MTRMLNFRTVWCCSLIILLHKVCWLYITPLVFVTLLIDELYGWNFLIILILFQNMITFLIFLLNNFITNIANMFIKILVLSLGEKQYEEGPLAGKKLPKPVQLLGFLLTGATVVSVILIFSHFTFWLSRAINRIVSYSVSYNLLKSGEPSCCRSSAAFQVCSIPMHCNVGGVGDDGDDHSENEDDTVMVHT